MRLMIAFLSLALSGCWVGSNFYAAGDLRQAIPPGDYRMTATSGERGPDRVRVSVLANGMTQLAPVGEDGRASEVDRTTVGFAALDADAGLFVGWQFEPDARPLDEGVRAYWVLRREGTRFTMLMPFCSGVDARVALEAGGSAADPQGGGGCQFSSRQSLEAGLRMVLPRLQPALFLTPFAPR